MSGYWISTCFSWPRRYLGRSLSSTMVEERRREHPTHHSTNSSPSLVRCRMMQKADWIAKSSTTMSSDSSKLAQKQHELDGFSELKSSASSLLTIGKDSTSNNQPCRHPTNPHRRSNNNRSSISSNNWEGAGSSFMSCASSFKREVGKEVNASNKLFQAQFIQEIATRHLAGWWCTNRFYFACKCCQWFFVRWYAWIFGKYISC